MLFKVAGNLLEKIINTEMVNLIVYMKNQENLMFIKQIFNKNN